MVPYVHVQQVPAGSIRGVDGIVVSLKVRVEGIGAADRFCREQLGEYDLGRCGPQVVVRIVAVAGALEIEMCDAPVVCSGGDTELSLAIVEIQLNIGCRCTASARRTRVCKV